MNSKKGASVITLTIYALIMAFTTYAVVIATSDFGKFYRAELEKEKYEKNQSLAYVKIYTKEDVENVARQAFANNYLSFYDNVVDLTGFEALVVNEVQNKIPEEQLEKYDIIVIQDRVIVNEI